MTSKSSILTIAILFIAMSSEAQVTDKDRNTYRTVKIGTQVWMGENLTVSYFRNGDAIPEAKTQEDWQKAGDEGKPAWCYYENDPANGEKYGKLYNWYAVNDPRGLAPEGWHVPSDAEWTKLTEYLGGHKIAGARMKATSGWTSNGDRNRNGTNTSGFAALPGGDRNYNGLFYNIGVYGKWWSSTEEWTTQMLMRYLTFDNFEYPDHSVKQAGLSVRCIKD
jgi:uncharacterized protein (TIGR02145 family)